MSHLRRPRPVKSGRPSTEASIKKRSAGRPPASEGAAHREAILNAATELFLARGFTRASTAEIAKRSGASKQTLYALFPSKAALFEGLMHRYLQTLTASLVPVIPPDDASAEEVLQRFGIQMVREVLSKPRQDLFRIVVTEAQQFPELATTFWDSANGRSRKLLNTLLDVLIERGLLQIENTAVAADHFLGSILWVLLIRFTLRMEIPVRTEEEIAEWVRSGVQPFVRAYQCAKP